MQETMQAIKPPLKKKTSCFGESQLEVKRENEKIKTWLVS